MIMIVLAAIHIVAVMLWTLALWLWIKQTKESTQQMYNQSVSIANLGKEQERLNFLVVELEKSRQQWIVAVDKLHRSESIRIEGEKKLPPANRKPRTEEQKRLISEKKKAYWAQKKAQEQQAPTLVMTP